MISIPLSLFVQLNGLTMEKKLLVEKLWDAKNITSVTGCNNEDGDSKELPFLNNGVSNATSIKTSVEAVTESLDKSSQAGIPFDFHIREKLMI